MKIAVIGGGAAGFFAAIQAKTNFPSAEVVLYEKTQKVLAKVKVSGGGRCNVTNGSTSLKTLVDGYPRGAKLMKKALRRFDNQDMMRWLEQRGVALKTEPDLRVFPLSDSSQTIIDCLTGECRNLGIRIVTGKGVRCLHPDTGGFKLEFSNPDLLIEAADKVIVATGGTPKRQGMEWLEQLGHQIEDPVPSLFTFNMPDETVTQLMGVVAEPVLLSIQGAKLKSSGPLLITHWGMSGPAVLKLSAFGARLLNEQNYQFKVQVSWADTLNNETVREQLQEIVQAHPQKHLVNQRPFHLPERLWVFLIEKCALPAEKKWAELGKKGLNKLINILTNDVYTVSGKTTFKEEFVTCGGISLNSIDPQTLQSKACPNLYFAGEILDIDGITGGYNFQAAWTTAYIAGQLQ